MPAYAIVRIPKHMFAGSPDDLIQRIMAAKLFSGAPQMCRLLEYFYDNKDRRIPAEELEQEHYGRLKGTSEYDPAHARLNANELKNKLAKYTQQAPQEEWLHCELLPSNRSGDGYQLRFYASSAAALFWSPHLSSQKKLSVICESLLFFYDHDKGKMLRFVDTNIDKPDRKDALKELERLHPGTNPDNSFVPGHFYFNAGAIMAAESLRDYFGNIFKQRVPLLFTKDIQINQLFPYSPVILGTIQTNPIMRVIFSSPKTEIAYRMSEGILPWVTIEKPTQREIEVLGKSLGMKRDSDGNGVLELRGNGRLESSEPSVGIVTRLANPLGTGPFTFISSYSVLNVAKIAAALTDEKRMKEFFLQMDWPLEPPLAASFEMMFRVNLAPANMDDEAGDAELLCWRWRPN